MTATDQQLAREAIRAALDRKAEPQSVTGILPLAQSRAGGSGAFLVRADDGHRYWCKVVDNPQSPRVPVNEQVVGRLGRWLGCAVCDVALLRIPAELEGWEYRPGRKLVQGYAHASRALDPAIETRAVLHPRDDDNPSRLSTLDVLADWCWAGDHQWLYVPNEENRYYSHDHGHYFPGGPNWSRASLGATSSAQKPPFPVIPTGVGPLSEIAAKLAAADAATIAGVLSGLPIAWPVSDDDLIDLVQFLDGRRGSVVARIPGATVQGVIQ